jgi:four helix bundle protein
MQFHDKLKEKMDLQAHLAYRITKSFPREEIYGLTSQLRRAAVSVVLNYVEGFARRKPLVMKNFFEISFGSLKEVRYLLEFCDKEGLIKDDDSLTQILIINDEIGAMLWSSLQKME